MSLPLSLIKQETGSLHRLFLVSLCTTTPGALLWFCSSGCLLLLDSPPPRCSALTHFSLSETLRITATGACSSAPKKNPKTPSSSPWGTFSFAHSSPDSMQSVRGPDLYALRKRKLGPLPSGPAIAQRLFPGVGCGVGPCPPFCRLLLGLIRWLSRGNAPLASSAKSFHNRLSSPIHQNK